MNYLQVVEQETINSEVNFEVTQGMDLEEDSGSDVTEIEFH